jgi:hypothetical protein
MKSNRYVICESCQAMNPSFGEKCDQCGAALSAAENLEPVERRPARRTYFQQPSTMRLIGMWSIALPNVVAGICLPLLLFRHFGGLVGFILFWGDVGITCIWFVILYRVTRYYFFPVPRQAE